MGKIKKLNLVDALALGLVLMLGVLIVVIVGQPERDLGETAQLTVRVENATEALFTEANKKGVVYLNGVDTPAEVIDTAKDGEALIITIQGEGTSDEGYIFNGQKILINQKAEVHGSFWAQGTITGFEIK
jgi:hypothetical protein